MKPTPVFQSENYTARALPRVFVLELTQRCNNKCLYCYTVWGAPELAYAEGNKGEMSSSEIKDIILKLQSECPVETIVLSGGEPLLRRDLPEILSFIRAQNIEPIIISNGTLLTPERVATTMVGGNYEVSLLSYQPEVHDRLAGRRGAWEAAIDGMVNVKNAGGNLISVFIATKLNYADVEKTAELAIALGALAFMYNRINLGKYNLAYADQLLPTADMINENLCVLDKIAAKYGLPVAISVVCEPCVVNTSGYSHVHFGWCPLAGEDSYFTIDPIGNVRICNHSPIILGNIKEQSFRDIYYHHPYVRSFHDTLPIECENCAPHLKAICRGGCKAAGEQCYGSLARVDPFVTLNKTK